MHTGKKPFACTEPGCDRKFSDRSGLRYHRAAVHSNERPHKCQFCTKAFIRKRSLTMHMKKHQGQVQPPPLSPKRKAVVDSDSLVDDDVPSKAAKRTTTTSDASSTSSQGLAGASGSTASNGPGHGGTLASLDMSQFALQ